MANETVDITIKTVFEGVASLGTFVDELDKVSSAVEQLDAKLNEADKAYGAYNKYIDGTTTKLKALLTAQQAVNSAIAPTTKIPTASIDNSAVTIEEELQQNIAKVRKAAADVRYKSIKDEYGRELNIAKAHAMAVSAEATRAARELVALETKHSNTIIEDNKRALAVQKTLVTQRTKMNKESLAESEAAVEQALLDNKALEQGFTQFYINEVKKRHKGAARQEQAYAKSRNAYYNRLGNEFVKANNAQKSFNNSLKTTTSLTEKVNVAFENLGGHIFKVVIGYRAVNAALNTIRDTLLGIPKALIDLQTTQSVFASTLGNLSISASVMKELRIEAQRTGISISVLRENFRNLNASMVLAGETTEDSWKVFINMNTAITALHLSADKAQNIFLALSQIFNKGKVQSEELTKQLGNLLPGAFAAFAKATGRSTAKLAADMQKGLVAAHEELVKFAEFYGKTFSEAMEVAAVGLQANLGRLQTSFTLLSESLGSSLEEPMIDTVKAATEMIVVFTELTKKTYVVKAAIDLVGVAITTLAARYIVPVTAAIGGMAAEFYVLSRAIGVASAAAVGLRAAMSFLISPVGIVLSIGSIATAINLIGGAAKEGSDKVVAFGRTMKKFHAERAREAAVASGLPPLITDIDNLPSIQQANESIDFYKKELQKIQDSLAEERPTHALTFGMFGTSPESLKTAKTAYEAVLVHLYSEREKLREKEKKDIETAQKERADSELASATKGQAALHRVTLSNTKELLARIKLEYKDNEISIKEYYDRRTVLETKLFNEQIQRLETRRQKELALAAASRTDSGTEHLSRANKLADQIAVVRQNSNAKALDTARERNKEQLKFTDAVIASDIAYQKLVGDFSEAARIQNTLNDFIEKGLKAEVASGKDPEAAQRQQDQIKYTEAHTLAVGELADVTEGLAQVEAAHANKQVVYDAKRAAGLTTELQTMLKRTEANQVYIDQQRLLIEQAEASYNPAADKNLKTRESIDAMTASLYAFEYTANEVVVMAQTTLTDALSNSFSDFITGAKSAGEAMKDFALTVIDSLAQIAAQELANSIIGGLFSVVGGIGSTASSSSSSLFTGSTNMAANAVNLDDFFKGSFDSISGFAKGGIPDIGSTPALFQLGSLREDGPEAILPLKRSANGDLGVVAVGGTGASGVSIGSINISVVEKEDSTTEEQAAAISKAVHIQLKSLVDGRLTNAIRPGNVLNPTAAQGVF